jgi:nucleotide-binding universal stress UspA family protein
VFYEFVEVEGEGDIGPILERYIEAEVPDCNLVVVGTHGHQGLKK